MTRSRTPKADPGDVPPRKEWEISVSNDRPRRLSESEREIEVEEEWIRATDEPQIRGVGAHKRVGMDWRITIWAAEFVRREPLVSELRGAVASALLRVEGVVGVEHEDTEQWIAYGNPRGEELVIAAAAAVDGLADQAREYEASMPRFDPREYLGLSDEEVQDRLRQSGWRP